MVDGQLPSSAGLNLRFRGVADVAHKSLLWGVGPLRNRKVGLQPIDGEAVQASLSAASSAIAVRGDGRFAALDTVGALIFRPCGIERSSLGTCLSPLLASDMGSDHFGRSRAQNLVAGRSVRCGVHGQSSGSRGSSPSRIGGRTASDDVVTSTVLTSVASFRRRSRSAWRCRHSI